MCFICVVAEAYTHPPSPVVCVLSTDGSLILYHTINRLQGADYSHITAPQPISLPSNVISQSADIQPLAQQTSFKMGGSAFGQPAGFGAQPSLGAAPAFGAKPGLGGASLFGAKPSVEPSAVFGAKPSVEPAAVFGVKPGVQPASVFGGKPAASGTTAFGGSSLQNSAGFTGFGALAAAVQPENKQVGSKVTA